MDIGAGALRPRGWRCNVARPRITPTRVARPFDLHELFFSSTDLKGIIRSGNGVFVRVSGYSEAELIGEPHNIIRHPDMPRAVFQLLWDYLQSDRPIAAHVKNLAKDGGYYWVLATVVRIDDGYLSVRLKPSAGLLPVVEEAYADLLRVEQRIESAGGTPKEAIAASTAELVERLPALGFADYDAFMRHALPAELASRRAQLAASGGRTARRGRASMDDLEQLRTASDTLTAFLNQQFSNRDQYVGLLDAFAEKAAFIHAFSDDVQLFSINALIMSARLRESGATLGAVADLMRIRSNATVEAIERMSTEIEAMRGVQESLVLDLSLATLQSEAIGQFVDEFIERGDAPAADDAGRVDVTSINVAALAGRLRVDVAPMLELLHSLEERFERMVSSAERLDSELRQLSALQVMGRVEAAHLADAADFRMIFEEVRQRIAVAANELSALRAGNDVLKQMRRGRATAATGRSLDHIERWTSGIVAA